MKSKLDFPPFIIEHTLVQHFNIFLLVIYKKKRNMVYQQLFFFNPVPYHNFLGLWNREHPQEPCHREDDCWRMWYPAGCEPSVCEAGNIDTGTVHLSLEMLQQIIRFFLTRAKVGREVGCLCSNMIEKLSGSASSSATIWSSPPGLMPAGRRTNLGKIIQSKLIVKSFLPWLGHKHLDFFIALLTFDTILNIIIFTVVR